MAQPLTPPHVTGMPDEALCGDCLRVIALSDLSPDDNHPPGLCPWCGGAACTCAQCVQDIDHLRAGRLADVALRPGLRLVSWNQETGGVLEEGPRPPDTAAALCWEI